MGSDAHGMRSGHGDGRGGGRGRTPGFDDQASGFDERAGLPEAAVPPIVDALALLASLGPDSTVLELGAGTGQLGVALARRTGRYVGVERSPAMLQRFRERASSAKTALDLLEADANDRWPLADGAATLVFGSRSLHLLDHGHLVAESLRVARPGGATVCAGRIVRGPEGIRSQMRQAMRRILESRHGIVARDGGDDTWIGALAARGAQPLEPLVAMSWSVSMRPAAALASWREKQGLAGHDVSEEIKSDVLERLRLWAVERFGDLDLAVPAEERYLLRAVRFG